MRDAKYSNSLLNRSAAVRLPAAGMPIELVAQSSDGPGAELLLPITEPSNNLAPILLGFSGKP
jgi:hypothetical protein